MDDFKWFYSNFITQMYTSAYREIIQDKEWQQNEDYLNKNRDKLQQLMETLNEQDKIFLNEYIKNISSKDAGISENMYIAGYKDCVKLLRELGVTIG